MELNAKSITREEQTKITRDAEKALDGLLIDSGMLSGNTQLCTTEVGKKALHIFRQFEADPTKIRFSDLQDLVYSEGTQIGQPGNYLSHVSNTGGILRSLVVQLEKIHQGRLKIPHPDVARSMGLSHDLNATFSNYAVGGQQSKEFDEFLLARSLGLPLIAENVALHSDYLGGIRLMTEGADFSKKAAYSGMIQVLKGDGPLSYNAIEEEFRAYLDGRDRLHLLLLTVSDYMENGQPHFDVGKFDENFKVRSKDIVWRYYGKAIEEEKTPSLLGQALVSGGMKRIQLYKTIVDKLLQNKPQEIEELEKTTNFFHE